ncbi:MAG: glycosyltransferase family 9 protein [Flavobacteriales bacterium]
MKILVVRFSSIGDIVLTTSVVRALHKKFPDADISYVTKEAYKEIVAANPNINYVYSFKTDLNEVLPALKEKKFDIIVDLHRNLRSAKIKRALKVQSYTFPKLNFKKWMLVNLRINKMPEIHIVDRYFKAVEKLDVKNDGLGLDYFIPENTRPMSALIPAAFTTGYVAIVIGAAHVTKAMPENKLEFICKNINYPVVLIGGKNEKEAGDRLVSAAGKQVYNAAGALSLNESAQVIKNAKAVITPDTGMMHIAAAFQKPVISVWGNTIPEFGMYAYLPGKETNSIIFENKNLKCRPCSKIGYKKCPKGHFKCMNELDYDKLLSVVKQRL